MSESFIQKFEAFKKKVAVHKKDNFKVKLQLIALLLVLLTCVVLSWVYLERVKGITLMDILILCLPLLGAAGLLSILEKEMKNLHERAIVLTEELEHIKALKDESPWQSK